MDNAATLDFPFVEDLPKLADLPKRERTKLQKVWDRFEELSKLQEEKGMLMPVRFAAKILDVSRPRCDELIHNGDLECIDLDGQRFVTGNSVVAYAKSERKAGRPLKVQTSKESNARIAWRILGQIGSDLQQGK
jgi:hypothetical protein